MRVIICGSRHWQRARLINTVLGMLPRDVVIATSEAQGADGIARKIARDLYMRLEVFTADWSRYGRAAGPKRNERMLLPGADLVIAFHDDLKSSKGTQDMIRRAQRAGVPFLLLTSEAQYADK